MSFSIKLGTGRAYCRFCRHQIQRWEPCVVYSGFQQSGQVHLLPEHCTYIQERLEELE